MPATRSSTAQSRGVSHPYSSHSPPPSATSSPDDIEVIVISSDDEDASPVPVVRRRPQKGKSKMHISSLLSAAPEVIEIPDTQRPVDKIPDNVPQLQKELRRLREETTRLRAEAAQIKKEQQVLRSDNASYIVELDRLRTEVKQKVKSVPTDAIEDIVTCEICALKMWSPYLLPDCGHMYCESCIMDWFSTIQVKHFATHPPAFHHQFNPMPRVPYTCPTCRAEVRTRPAECFVVKQTVHLIADIAGESSPRRPVSRKVGAAASARREGVWDVFFGPRV